MSTPVRKSNNPMHFSHYKGVVNRDDLLVSVANGLLRYRNSDQAITSGYERHVIHELQPKRTAPTDFFSGTNNFIDVELPQHLDAIDQLDLHMDFHNADSVNDMSFNNTPSNLISRVEVRVGSEIKETITDVEAWINQIPYTNPWEFANQQDSSKISPSTYKVSFDITAYSDSGTIRVPIRNVISQCGIPTSAVSDQVTLRFYSQDSSNVVNGSSNFELADFKVHAREKRRTDEQIAKSARLNQDYRYLQPKLEEKSIALTKDTTVKTVLNNFTEDDLCSHMWVLIRASNPTGTDQDNYLKVGTNVYLENEAGQNITNGIQWAGTDLLNFIYPDKFDNNAKSAHGLYLPLCPTQDPVDDYNEGGQNGVQPLSRNMKLCIVSSATATYYVTVVAMCQRHVRVDQGKLSIQ